MTDRLRSVRRFLAHAIAIAAKDFARLRRDRGGLVLLLVVPVALTAIVGYSLSQRHEVAGGTPPSGSASNASVIGLLVQDSDEYAGHFATLLENQGVTPLRVGSPEALQRGLLSGRWMLAVTVPADFSARVRGGAPAAVSVVVGRAPTVATWRMIGVLELATGSLDAARRAGRSSADIVAARAPLAEQLRLRDSVERAILLAIVAKRTALVALNVRTASARGPSSAGAVAAETLDGTTVNIFDQVVPGYAVMFALFGIGAGAATLLEEQRSGTYRRLLTTPASRGSIILGKILFQFVLTLAQVLVLLGIGLLAFHMSARLWPMLLLHVVALSFATTAFGMLLVSLVRSSRQLSTLSTMTILGFSAIGGSWWPLWQQPEWLQQAAKISVTYWAMRGFNAIMIFGESASSVAPATLGLVAYGLIAYAVAWRRLERQAAA